MSFETMDRRKFLYKSAAGVGSLAITAVAWFALSGLRDTSAARTDIVPTAPEPEPEADPNRPATRRDAARTPAVRHQ